MLIFFNFLCGGGACSVADILVNLIVSLSFFSDLAVSNFAFAAVEPFISGFTVFIFASAFSLSAKAFFSFVSLSEASFNLADNANFSSLSEVFSFRTGGLARVPANAGSSISFL